MGVQAVACAPLPNNIIGAKIMLYKKKNVLLILMGPTLLIMIIFMYYPFFVNIFDSMYDINGLGGAKDTFIGLANYKKLFQDEHMLTALKNTFVLMFCIVLFQVGIGLVLALMVDSIKKGQKFFKTVYFFPIVISATAIGLMVNLFYSYYGGMFNQILAVFGKDSINWKSDELALIMIILPIIWSYVGFYFVLLVTGINNISADIFESAELDGATGLKKIWYITLPLLRNVIATCVTLAITGSLKTFDLPWIIAPRGAPKGLTHFAGTYMYETTFIADNVDYGATIALVIVVLGVAVSQIANIFLKEKEM